MKLASLKGGRDGRLVVVSDDLAWCADARHIAPTFQAALDDWEALAPALENLATDLAHEAIPMMRFHERSAAAPLPRAYHRRARSADGHLQLAQSDSFLAPRDPLHHGVSMTSGIAVITGDVPRGADRATATAAIELVLIVGDAGEQATLSPVAVTPSALGRAWRDGRLSGLPAMTRNGGPQQGEVGGETDLAQLVIDAAAKRPLSAGAVLSITTGSSSEAGRVGDVLRIEMRDDQGHPIFGVIEQTIDST